MSRRQLFFGVVVGTIVVLVSVALAEVVLRVYARTASTSLAAALRVDPFAVLVEPHGDAGYRPRPERTFDYDNGARATVNTMGFRGPGVAVPKPPGTLRIVLLGGSSTFGWGVDDHETIDSYMREALLERYPDRTIEVVNLAFDGYDSYQLYERFRSDGLALEPDVVIVNSGVNDVRNAWYRDIRDGDRRTMLYLGTLDQLRFELERGGPTIWSRIKHWFHVARVPGWVHQQVRLAGSRSVAQDLQPAAYHWDALDYFERNVQRLLVLAADSANAIVLFSTPPSSLHPGDEHPLVSYWLHDARSTQEYRDSLSVRGQAVVAEEAGKGRVAAYVPHEELPRAFFLDDAHLTPEGNRRMAEDFVAALEPWIERRGRRSP